MRWGRGCPMVFPAQGMERDSTTLSVLVYMANKSCAFWTKYISEMNFMCFAVSNSEITLLKKWNNQDFEPSPK